MHFNKESSYVINLINKSSTFYRLQRQITMFTVICHWVASWSTLIQSTVSHLFALCSTLMLSLYLHLGRLFGFFYLGFSTKTVCIFLTFTLSATSPTHLIFLSFIIIIILVVLYALGGWSLCNFIQPTATVHLRSKHFSKLPLLKL